MPVLTVIAGPNGSGKSTLIASLRSQGVEFGAYFNADDIAVDLTGPPDEMARQAQAMVRERRAEALAKDVDHSFETVMSHVSHLDYMRAALDRGFDVRLFFVATEKPEINLARVANRVAHGGHDVPRDRIVARYFKCLENLPRAIATSSVALIFDNSQSSRPHRLLAKICDRQLSHDRSSFPGTLFERMAAVAAGRTIDPQATPAWWLTILLRIKPNEPFLDGQIS